MLSLLHTVTEQALPTDTNGFVSRIRLTAQLPLTGDRFSSRAHFPKCCCFKSKMSDISESNTPRCFFIFTASKIVFRLVMKCFFLFVFIIDTIVLTVRRFECQRAPGITFLRLWKYLRILFTQTLRYYCKCTFSTCITDVSACPRMISTDV